MLGASRSLTRHILRGVAGFSLIGLAVLLVPLSGWALLLAPLGLVFLRGCPMCWTMTLIEGLYSPRSFGDGSSAEPFCATCSVEPQGDTRRGNERDNNWR